ncbi:MAG: hypothetical protein DRH08_13260 [Deltaproteobacteria bacterium]|nr:MAG: hypothetical protein DRH08_13260 [Deltaproteobacteria bacterium]
MSLQIIAGGNWRNVNQIQIIAGGSWRNVTEAYIVAGGQWVKWWGAAPPPVQYTYLANWANSYSGTAINTSSHRDELNYQGESSYHGEESSLWGFDDALMRADLAGKTILSVTARITSRWTYAGGGKYFHIMPHNHADKPSTAVLSPNFVSVLLPRDGTGTVVLPVSFGEQLRDGTMKGIGLKFEQPGENEWGYCTGMYTTFSPVASPEDWDIAVCPTDQLAMLTIVTA